MLGRSALLGVALLVACGDDEPPPAVEPAPVAAPEPEPEPVVEVEPESAPIAPSTHELLFLVVHEAPLLPSEERLIGVEEARLDRRNDVERRDATEEEAALAEAFLDGSAEDRAAASLPATFGEARRVLVMRVAEPRTRSDGDLVSRGFTGVLVFRPPAVEPVFEQRMDEEAAWRLTDDQWSRWLTGLLREGGDT